MKTAVITDSNSGITKEEARKLGLFLMPMPVIIDGEVYYEGENLTEAEFFEALKDGRDVTTSAFAGRGAGSVGSGAGAGIR